MSNFTQMVRDAEAGEHWAQRMLVGYLGMAADDTDDPATLLDEAAHWARLAARGSEEDFATLLFVLVKRGALPGGDDAGGEAIARLDLAASHGYSECDVHLQRLSDALPPAVSQRFFAKAKEIRRSSPDMQG